MESKRSFQRFMLLWTGGFISAIGSGLTSFGLSVYVFQQTGLASSTALVALLAFLPSLLLSPLAGILSDRYDRRLMMILGDSLSAIGILWILLCMLIGEAQLWQICVGVSISSIFSSLLEPSYRATISDLLTENEYTKASGIVQISSSAKYLISPILAGFLLTVSDIKLLLILDICTFFVTVTSTFAVRKGLSSKITEKTSSMIQEFKDGWRTVSATKGIWTLVIMSSVISLFLGIIQTLASPMILSFTDSAALGNAMTISALGMLVTSILLGFVPIKKSFVAILSISLMMSGIFMAGFGATETMWTICLFGFLFFATLPFANTCLDYLIRTNIDNEMQGRVWGLLGIISQLGYVVAYAFSGLLSDYVFKPLLVEQGALSSTVGSVIGTGMGRGAGFLVIVSGVLLCITAIFLIGNKPVNSLERRGA